MIYLNFIILMLICFLFMMLDVNYGNIWLREQLQEDGVSLNGAA